MTMEGIELIAGVRSSYTGRHPARAFEAHLMLKLIGIGLNPCTPPTPTPPQPLTPPPCHPLLTPCGVQLCAQVRMPERPPPSAPWTLQPTCPPNCPPSATNPRWTPQPLSGLRSTQSGKRCCTLPSTWQKARHSQRTCPTVNCSRRCPEPSRQCRGHPALGSRRGRRSTATAHNPQRRPPVVARHLPPLHLQKVPRSTWCLPRPAGSSGWGCTITNGRECRTSSTAGALVVVSLDPAVLASC